ncbi:DHHW family protein [Faecalimicrobium sp. JNUCC 81]
MKYKYTTSILVIGFTLFVGGMSILTPDKLISQQEGRTLQPLPKGETSEEGSYKKELLNGGAFKKWDNYFSDHIYGRSNFVNTYTDIQMNLGKKYINGIYLGEDNELIKSGNYGIYDEEYRTKRAEHFNKFADKFKNAKTYVVNIPNKNYAYEEKMPIKDFKSGQSIFIGDILNKIDKAKIKVLDLTEEIRKDKNNYYKTDHHLNMNGAYSSYKFIIESINKDIPQVQKPKEKPEFKIKTYEDVFIGSYGRQVLNVVDKMDDIQVYKDKNFKDYKVYNQNGEAKLFYEEQISKDKLDNDYEVYLGGDKPLVKIENKQSNNELRVVAIGDSMDNPIIPLLASHFKTTYSFDLRGYEGNLIKEIENINPDVILLIGASNNYIMSTDIFNWDKK